MGACERHEQGQCRATAACRTLPTRPDEGREGSSAANTSRQGVCHPSCTPCAIAGKGKHITRPLFHSRRGRSHAPLGIPLATSSQKEGGGRRSVHRLAVCFSVRAQLPKGHAGTRGSRGRRHPKVEGRTLLRGKGAGDWGRAACDASGRGGWRRPGCPWMDGWMGVEYPGCQGNGGATNPAKNPSLPATSPRLEDEPPYAWGGMTTPEGAKAMPDGGVYRDCDGCCRCCGCRGIACGGGGSM